MRFANGLPALLLVFVAACSSATADYTTAQPSANRTAVAVSPTPSPIASPTASPKPDPTPSAYRLVSFSGLRAGLYPVHLHSRCDGSQQFHIVVLESLNVGTAGAGGIEVPRGYFGRGLCVIVYGSARLATVIATRTI